MPTLPDRAPSIWAAIAVFCFAGFFLRSHAEDPRSLTMDGSMQPGAASPIAPPEGPAIRWNGTLKNDGPGDLVLQAALSGIALPPQRVQPKGMARVAGELSDLSLECEGAVAQFHWRLEPKSAVDQRSRRGLWAALLALTALPWILLPLLRKLSADPHEDLAAVADGGKMASRAMIGVWLVIGAAALTALAPVVTSAITPSAIFTVGTVAEWSLVAVAWRCARWENESLVGRGSSTKVTWKRAVGAVVAFALIFVVFGLVGAWFPWLREVAGEPTVQSSVTSPGTPFTGMILGASAGICEELVFRGYLLSRITRLTGSHGWGIALSSLLFGLAHIPSGSQTVVATIIIGVLGALYAVKARSLVVPILGHAAFDVTVFILAYARDA